MQQLRMIHKFDNIPDVPVPQGFTVRNFRSGEELVWVEICKNGLLGQDAGMKDWEKDMLKLPLDPEKDVFFVCDANDKPVATFAGYVLPDGTGNVHMVAAAPEARGHGLGKFMVSAILKKMDKDVPAETHMLRLRTDDWRVPAVVGYLKGGFHPVLFDEGMEERWQKICDEVNFHGVEMLDLDGNGTGIVL